jgi:hypothetical protein
MRPWIHLHGGAAHATRPEKQNLFVGGSHIAMSLITFLSANDAIGCVGAFCAKFPAAG